MERMNQEPPVKPVELCLHQMLGSVKQFAQREPGQAVAAAIGVGLLINLLPTRVMVGTVAVVGASILRPLLLSLGVTKAMELLCQNPTPTLPE